MKKKIIYNFRIELDGIEPLIWRSIEVPKNYSFWDLHVAIQDSMGWLDYHLHSFSILPPRKRKPVLIGIPDPDYEDDTTVAGWEIPMTKYFNEPGDIAGYDYDFGDSWHHKITLEGIYLQKDGTKYPHCTNGKRACPPEDCGGIPGYYRLIETLQDPNSEEYTDMIFWLKNHAKNYYPYDPAYFNPTEIKFWNPKKRLKMAFQN
jgi:hypothetical protein